MCVFWFDSQLVLGSVFSYKPLPALVTRLLLVYNLYSYDLNRQHCCFLRQLISTWPRCLHWDRDRKSMSSLDVLLQHMQFLVFVAALCKVKCFTWGCFLFAVIASVAGSSSSFLNSSVILTTIQWHRLRCTQRNSGGDRKDAQLVAAPNYCSFSFLCVPLRFVPEKHKSSLDLNIIMQHCNIFSFLFHGIHNFFVQDFFLWGSLTITMKECLQTC